MWHTQSVFRQTCVLGIRTETLPGKCKNPVTIFKSLYLFACCFSLSGQLQPQYRVSGSPETNEYPHGDPEQDIDFATPDETVRDSYGCRLHFYQHFIVPGNRFFHFSQLKNLRRPKVCAYNCFHTYSSRIDVRVPGFLLSP